MPIPSALNEKIINRLNTLVVAANDLVPLLDSKSYSLHDMHIQEYEALIVNASNLVRMVFANSSDGKEYLQRLHKMAGDDQIQLNAMRIAGMLKGLKEDYENGYCETLETWISAEINTDYMRQARLLLNQEKSEELDHVLSAVVCGIVLENGLRWLCSQQSPEVKTVKRNGQPKRLNALIEDLQKEKAFNAIKGDQLRSWAKTRNHAAHGETDESSRQDVQSMINDVTTFMADYVYGK